MPRPRARLREGDLIVAINGRAVATVDDLLRTLAGTAIGAATTLSVIRGRDRLEVSVATMEAR